MSNTPPRIALVGVTGYGGVHFGYLHALAEKGVCRFAAAAVVNPEHPAAAKPLAWLRGHGVAVHPTAEALFAAERGSLDLVALPVGIAAHEPLVAAALDAGANVLVEKPAAGCVAAVDRMLAREAAAAPRRVFVGFQHVSAPEVRTIRRIVASGALGRPLSAVATGIWPRDDTYYARNGWAARLTAPDGTPVRDSPANNAFAHYVNLALLFVSTDPALPAEPLRAEGALYRARPDIETFDTCAVRLVTDGGVPVVLAFSHAAAENRNPRIRVRYERGTVLWSHEGPWEVRAAGGVLLASGTAVAPHESMFRAILDRVAPGATPGAPADDPPAAVCTLRMARAQVRAIEAMHDTLGIATLSRSATRREDGQWIVAGLLEAFERIWNSGDLLLPDWT